MFDSIFSLFSQDLGIDLGTANTLVFIRDKGIAVRESSIVVRHLKSKKIIIMRSELNKNTGIDIPRDEEMRYLSTATIISYQEELVIRTSKRERVELIS